MNSTVYLQWHITSNCGNRCTHCYQSYFGREDELPLADVSAILEDFQNTCTRLSARSVLAIAGGDPLAHPDFEEIIQSALEKSERVVVMGNPENLLRRADSIIPLISNSSRIRWQMSLDGLEETHDSIRRPGSFRRTVEAISILRDALVPVSVMTTVSATNFAEIEELMDVVYSLGISSWDFSRYVPTHGTVGLSPDVYRDFLERILAKKARLYSSYPTLSKEPLLGSIGSQVCKPCNNEFVGGCGLGSSSLVMLPDKTLMACRRYPESTLGKWSLEKGFLQYFLFDGKINHYRNAENYGDCYGCDHFYSCRGCRAIAHAGNNSFGGRDPQCWVQPGKQSRS